MTPQPSTSLRVRFAKAMGHDTTWYERELTRHEERPHLHDAISGLSKLPDPTDANTVREAMMGMTEGEKAILTQLVGMKLQLWGSSCNTAVYYTLFQLEPPTLAEFICEVRNV